MGLSNDEMMGGYPLVMTFTVCEFEAMAIEIVNFPMNSMVYDGI